MTSNPAAAIVVGIDGSPPSVHALDWAAREAVARHRPLRIVHAFRWPLTNELMGPPVVGPPDAGLQYAAEQRKPHIPQSPLPVTPVTGF
ncbi:universal stress protein [Micromonospora sp. MED01]|uniref:universal stress protein n=1 Tax=Micromonospora alfalfae TaxID=2911212 RepID=UPI001EE8D2C8|nr:universal stress protein [Micromonospora alfalfae]MCG5461623.1 universal stress protein [Micromonospora alfalfae]